MAVTTENQSEPGAQAGSQQKLLAMLKICQELNAERDLTALLDLIAQQATWLMEADRASVFLLDRSKAELCSKVATGTDEALRFDARLGIAGAAVQTGHTINASRAVEHPQFYPEMDGQTGYSTISLLAVPLRNFQNEIIGAFEVLNKKTGVFTKEDEEVAKSLAAHAAIAIETAQMVEELHRSRDRLQTENTQLRKEVEGRFSTRTILGTSEKIVRVRRMIEQITDTSVDVLITGESGTGKELVAKAIHYGSPRTHGPLIALNCAALPDNLVESELFGIEKGVATGVERRIGKFEAADKGTLFLDEIGDLSLAAQAKILRAVQERIIERVGARRPIAVDVRVLAATNKDLDAAITQRTFREDLYYRLKVVHIHLPPIREIRQDIPLLATYFLDRYCREWKKQPMKLAPSAVECLMRHPWPGNVRELEHEIKRVVVTAGHEIIGEGDLSEAIRSGGQGRPPSDPGAGSSLKNSVTELEKQMIREALQTSQQNQQKAAKLLGLSRQGLIKKMQRYGITPVPHE